MLQVRGYVFMYSMSTLAALYIFASYLHEQFINFPKRKKEKKPANAFAFDTWVLMHLFYQYQGSLYSEQEVKAVISYLKWERNNG